MRGRRFVAAMITLAAFFGSGCADDNETTGSTGQSDSGSDGADNGDSDGGDGAPDDNQSDADTSAISAPLAPGADAVATSESGPLTVVQFIVPLDQREATIAFYDEWTKSQSSDYQRIESATGGVLWQNAPPSGEERTMIAILSPFDGDDFVAVSLAVGPAE